MALNLSTLAITKESFDVELRHPATGEVLLDGGKPVTITILSKNSKEYRNISAAQINSRFKQKKQTDLTLEKLTADNTALLVAVTVGSSGLEYNGSEKIDFNELYNDESVSWIKDQVYLALEDVSNFLAQ